MIILLVFGLILDLSQTCPTNCVLCDSSGCITCSSGYNLNNSSGNCITNDLNTGVITGIVVGVVVMIAIIVFIIRQLMQCCPHNQPQLSNNQVGATDTNINRYYFSSNIQWQNIQFDGQQFSRQQICTICLNKSLDTKTHCGHGFHSECLFIWFNKHSTCPTCRTEIDYIVLCCKNCYRSHKIIKLAGIKDIKRQAKVCDLCAIVLS